jgi:hypothetical protein
MVLVITQIFTSLPKANGQQVNNSCACNEPDATANAEILRELQRMRARIAELEARLKEKSVSTAPAAQAKSGQTLVVSREPFRRLGHPSLLVILLNAHCKED